jgi:hypothetical protein
MVSRAFLASTYITDQERPISMQMNRDKRAVIVPVLLSACSWEAEDFACFENLPGKGTVLASIRPRDKAWTLVEEGIKRAVESLRSANL